MSKDITHPWYIVTGTGRSGTSAVASVLHESGIAMGTAFDAPSEHNARGFYEDLHALDINRRILADAGLDDLRLAPELPSRATFLAAAEPYAEEMRRVASTGAQGWKDPRFCFTLEAWMRALDTRPRVIVCLRGPESYLHSVMRIVGLIEREVAEAWWERHLRRLLDVIDEYELEAHCVEYDALAADPQDTVASLSHFVGHPLDGRYVDPSLRSHTYRVPLRHRELYRRVLALGAHGVAPEPEASNDAAAIEPYASAARGIERRIAKARVLWEESFDEDARAACAAFDAALGEAQAALLALEPPDVFEPHYELLRDMIDVERFVAQVRGHSCAGGEPDAALARTAEDVWRRKASAEAHRLRAREFERALQAAQS